MTASRREERRVGHVVEWRRHAESAAVLPRWIRDRGVGRSRGLARAEGRLEGAGDEVGVAGVGPAAVAGEAEVGADVGGERVDGVGGVLLADVGGEDAALFE